MYSDAPDIDTFEMSVFGPGKGECILLHLGNQNWIVIDSFKDRESDKSIAFKYLMGMGLDPAYCIKRIIITHWHDDHIGGMADLVRETKRAEICFSAAYTSDEFLTLLELTKHIELIENSRGTREMAEVMDELLERSQKPILASSSKFIYGAPSGIEVIALSPSDATVIQSYKRSLQEYIARIKKGDIDTVPHLGPNNLSVVLKLYDQKSSILLGGDLEQVKDPDQGWGSVVQGNSASSMPTNAKSKSHIFKVPHHGSDTAHYDKIWTELLTGEPICIVTPYSCGRKPLPAIEDIDRMHKLGARVYCSFPPSGIPADRRDRYARHFRKATLKHMKLGDRNSQIRIRLPISDLTACAKIECKGAATFIAPIHQHEGGA